MKVQVLMSVYNSVHFFREQLDTVLQQSGVECNLLIRDDGSNNTEMNSIIDEYQKMFPGRISYYKGDNLRPALSFIDLIRRSDAAYDFYAFCDHDDIWDNDKILHAVNALSNLDAGTPNCYFCNYRMCNADGVMIAESNLPKEEFKTTADNLLLCNPAPGCCIVFNRTAREMIAMHEAPSYIIMHDCWLILLCSTIGNVVYDPQTHISYRQHGTNAIGYATSLPAKLRFRVKYFFNKENHNTHSKQCQAFYKQYGYMIKPEYVKLIKLICNTEKNLFARIGLAANIRFTSYNARNTLYFKLCILFGMW